MTEIAEAQVSDQERRQKLIEFIRSQKPINNHILKEIPTEMRNSWNEIFMERFIELFGNGAPAPDGFQQMVDAGTEQWSRESLERTFRKKAQNKEQLELIMRDRCKNTHRKLLFGPVNFTTMTKLFSWVLILVMIPERLVFDPKFRSCFDFAREWQPGLSPNTLIDYLRARIVGTSLLDIATACLAGEFGAGFDVVSAFRNILAAPEWWPFQILPVWMPDTEEVWWSLAPTVEFGKRNAASIWTAAYKTFFAYWDQKAGRRIAYLPVNPCSSFGLGNTKIIPASVKWQELDSVRRAENRNLPNAIQRSWVDSITQLLGTPDYNDMFWRNVPGYDLRSVHPGNDLQAVIPYYRRCDDFNKIASEWRQGDDHIIARTTTIDDTLLFSNQLEPLKEAHLLFLEGHRDSHLGIDFAKTTVTPTTKVDMIGYEIDFKNKTLKVKDKKLKKYDLFWTELKTFEQVSVETWAKIVGRLLFAASLSPWKLKDIHPWIQPYKKLVRSIYSKLPLNWMEEKFWNHIRDRLLLVTPEMRQVATELFSGARIPVPAIELVLQPFDGGPNTIAMTDASNLAMGGAYINSNPRPWSVTFEQIDGQAVLGGIPLPRRWSQWFRRNTKARVGNASHAINSSTDRTCIHIGAAEYLGVCTQIAILIQDGMFQQQTKKLITMVGDNTSVAWSLIKKKSEFYLPFLDWIESKLRPKQWNITSSRVQTHIFPVDVLSRPASEGIQWNSWNEKVGQLLEQDSRKLFQVLKLWPEAPLQLRTDAQAIAERTWFEINFFAKRRKMWMYAPI